MTALSFRPWARSNQAPEQGLLQDVLARVNVERGHFRDITEASLLEEIASAGAIQSSESESDDELDKAQNEQEYAEKADEKPKTREDLFKAKFEMLQHVQAANNDVMIALDYISLLQSKDAPAQAATTISPNLKQTVPLGSLGADVWQRMTPDKRREEQDEKLAVSVRMSALQSSADSLLKAAERLHNSVKNETQYWDRVLSITSKGWNICRIPGSQQRLGVTFGFSESTPEFSRRGVAALATRSDGEIILEHGAGSKPRSLVVTIKNDGKVVGQSTSVRSAFEGNDEGQHLQSQIRQARDNLFDAELFRDLVRESRELGSLGFQVQGEGIHLRLNGLSGAEMEVIFELVSPHSHNSVVSAGEQDPFASAIALTSRLLLTQAHRDRLKDRSEVPAPLSSRNTEHTPPSILRPILAFIMHMLASEQVNSYMDEVKNVLATAQIVSEVDRATVMPDSKQHVESVDHLTSSFTRPWTSRTTLWVISGDHKAFDICIEITTALTNGSGPMFSLGSSGTDPVAIVDMLSLREAADYKIACSLALVICETTTGSWRCSGHEPTLYKMSRDGDSPDRRFELSFNSTGRTITARSKLDSTSWQVDGMSSEQSFWNLLSDAS